jgi:hypothetical protein
VYYDYFLNCKEILYNWILLPSNARIAILPWILITYNLKFSKLKNIINLQIPVRDDLPEMAGLIDKIT